MADEKNTDSKVFDVAKPTEAKKDIGSKPMIIGHKSLKEDPMVKSPAIQTEEQPAEEPIETKSEEKVVTPPSVSKKVITPPSEQEKKEEQSKEEPPATDVKEDVEDASEDAVDEVQKVDPEVEKNEKNEKLQNMIASKKYFVTVHEQSSSHVKVFLITFIIALLIGVAAVALLIDAEILDVGVELPFDLL